MGEGLKHRFLGNPMPSYDEDDESNEELFESFSSDSEDDNSAVNATHLPSDSCNGPLYELSSLMEQLPVKKGLSKHYQGKSQSFTSLADVQCLEDLPKKETTYIRKMKPCMSYADGIDAQGSCNKAMSKKTPRVASCASFISSSNSSFNGGGKPPSVPVQKSIWPY